MVRSPRSDSPADIALLGFVAGTGGASRIMLTLGRSLADLGLRVELVVPDFPSIAPLAASCAEAGLPLRRTRALRLAYRTRAGGAFRIARAALLLRRLRARVVHYHLTEDTMPLAFTRALRLSPARPGIATVHQADPFGIGPTPQTAAFAALVPGRIDRVVGVSRRTLEIQRSFGIPPGNLELVYNGVEAAQPTRSPDEVRRSMGVPEGGRLVLFVARWAAEKRPLDALEAFVRITDEVPDAHLAMAGSGELDAQVVAAAADLRPELSRRVHILGYRRDVADLLHAADVWILPTEFEAFSVGVLEALAAGCAILTTDVTGNDEVLRHGDNALLVRPRDVDRLAHALRRLLTDEDLRARLIDSGRRTMSRFSHATMLDAYINLYERALAAHGAPPLFGAPGK